MMLLTTELDLITLESGITYIFSHYFSKVKVDFYDFLPIGKILTLHDVITQIKSVLNKDINHCYCKIFKKSARQLKIQLAKK